MAKVDVDFVTKVVEIEVNDGKEDSLAAMAAINAAKKAEQYYANTRAELEGIVDEGNTILTAIRNEYGYPFTASTAAAMTDPTKIYIYTGSEDGYTNGNWYYHNGTAFVSGGVYNSTAFETDKTLMVDGAAADAEATGAKIQNAKSEINYITGNLANTAVTISGLYINPKPAKPGSYTAFLSAIADERLICINAEPDKEYVIKKNTATIMRVGVGSSDAMTAGAIIYNYSGHSTASNEPLYVNTDGVKHYIYIQLFSNDDSADLKSISANTDSLLVIEKDLIYQALETAKHDFNETSTKNIYTDENFTYEYYLNDSNSPTSASQGGYTDYIPCKGGRAYCFLATLWCSAYETYCYRIHQYDENKNWISMAASKSVGASATGEISVPFVTDINAAYIRVSIGQINISSNERLIESIDGSLTAVDSSAREMVEELKERTENTELIESCEIGGINSSTGANQSDTKVRSDFIAVNNGDIISLTQYGKKNGYALECYGYYTTSTYTDHIQYLGEMEVTDGACAVSNLNCAFVRVVVSNSMVTPTLDNISIFENAVSIIRNQHRFENDFLFPQNLQVFEKFFTSETNYNQSTVTAAQMVEKFDRMANLFTEENMTEGYYLDDSNNEVSAGYAIYTDYIPCESGESYCLHCLSVLASTSFYIRIHQYDASKNWISLATSLNVSSESVRNCNLPFTTNASAKYIRISIGAYKFVTNTVLLKTTETTLSSNGYFRKIMSGVDAYGNALAAYKYTPKKKGYYDYHILDSGTLHPFVYPKVMVVGNIHGRERSSAFSLLKLMELLTGKTYINDTIEFLRNNVEIVIVPVACPSGWDDVSYENRAGVNLNRDFPPYGNFSQPETQFIRDVFNSEKTGLNFYFDFHNTWWNELNMSGNNNRIKCDPILGYVYSDDPLYQRLGCNIYSMFKSRVNSAADYYVDYFSYCESARKGTSAVWARSQGITGTLFEIARKIPNLENVEYGNDVIIWGVNLLCSFITNSIYTLRLPKK